MKILPQASGSNAGASFASTTQFDGDANELRFRIRELSAPNRFFRLETSDD